MATLGGLFWMKSKTVIFFRLKVFEQNSCQSQSRDSVGWSHRSLNRTSQPAWWRCWQLFWWRSFWCMYTKRKHLLSLTLSVPQSHQQARQAGTQPASLVTMLTALLVSLVKKHCVREWFVGGNSTLVEHPLVWDQQEWQFRNFRKVIKHKDGLGSIMRNEAKQNNQSFRDFTSVCLDWMVSFLGLIYQQLLQPSHHLFTSHQE